MLSIPLNVVDTYCIYGVGPHSGDKPGATLGHGQTVKVVSLDTTVVTFGPDFFYKRDKDGVQTIASGNIVPVRVGGPIVVTATVMNADGALGESKTDTITVTAAVLQLDTARATGDLFPTPLSLSHKAVEQPDRTARPAGGYPAKPAGGDPVPVTVIKK